MIRIVLVDDQAIVREGLRALLSMEPDMQVVGEASSGQEAIQMTRSMQPDIVLMDVRMPGMDGLAALERLKAERPETSVIMVTLYDDPDYLLRAVMAGAAGYILKDASRSELIRAVRVTASGGAIISPLMLRGLLQEVSRLFGDVPKKSAEDELPNLSQRELEVLRLVAEGCSNREIAERLILSPTTVKTHVQNILQKMGVSDRTQAAVTAIRSGLIN
ncbi:MAG: response regulator transcription factor [Anaerolineae bacterium]|nr:response regulator transcription factor [Anaerolineae bacterium]